MGKCLITKIVTYPVGSIYFSTNSVNPSTLFGGTWNQLTSDAYFKIVTSDAGSLGGTSSDHRIPLTSLPPHTHTHQSRQINASGSNDVVVRFSGSTTTTSVGGGQPWHPYYCGIYAWVRVS